MSDLIIQFYDRLAAGYDRIFASWQASLRRQGEILHRLIQAQSPAARTVLDCSCGIGTQALGLAIQGCEVTATDLSPQAVKRASEEAGQLGLSLNFGVADMRRLAETVQGTFDVVLSCDNAWAHLLTDDDLNAAARSMADRLNRNGLLLVGLRDYDVALLTRPTSKGPDIFDDPSGKRIVFQVWDWWADGRGYTLHHYITHRDEDEWITTHLVTDLRALQRAEISAALEAADLADVRWHMPESSGYYQPIVTARKI